MATRPVYLEGKIKWAFRLKTPDMKYSKYGRYSADLYMNDYNIEKFKEMKVMNHLRKDEDGIYVRFSKDQAKEIRGKVVQFGPPIIKEIKDGVEVMTQDIAKIGNGSDVTIKLDHYDYKNPSGKTMYACRLTGMLVHNLVERQRDIDTSITDEKSTAGLSAQPAPQPW